MNASTLCYVTARFSGYKHSSNSLWALRGFSANRGPGDKTGSAYNPDQPQVDWKDWVASKFSDRIEKAHKKASTGIGKEDWNGDLGWKGEQIDLARDALNDGMDDKLKIAALEHDYGALRSDDDYSFRPDTTFPPGTQYKEQDLDLTKPAVQRIYRRPMFQTTTKEVLRKTDFRNARFLQNFITEAGILWPRKKFNISAKAQRKIACEIKTTRAFGLLPFTMMGKKPFAFGKTMEDLEEDYRFDDYVGNVDDLEDVPEIDAPDL